MNSLGVERVCLICGYTRPVPALSDFEYGAFVLYSDSGDYRGLEACEEAAFDEVSRIVESYPPARGLSESQRAPIIQSVYSVACDPDDKGNPFRIRSPLCPRCGSEHLEATRGEVGELLVMQHVSHVAWDHMAPAVRVALVQEAVDVCLELIRKEMKERRYL